MSGNFEAFGKYILLEKLQTGGMAEIYLARRPGASGVSKFLAIKRILPQFSEQHEFIEMFKVEAKIAINLSHANIVSIHEFGMERNQLFLAMEYVEGRNLRQILNKMKKSGVTFSIEQVLYIIKEIAGGLDHAHRCIDNNTGKPLNIIHRDMSPQNIMISFEGEVKVVDFGIAKAETQLDTTRAGTLKGKFGYMSPEQAEGQQVDLRTDIFALGIVLWELLANDRLFVANNEVNTLRKVRDCQIPSLRKINPNIPVELERIVAKVLAKDRNLRYQTAAALHRELSRFLNRQFPDFSPHDFSVFVKTLYAAEILDSRKKMIEYATAEGSRVEPSPGPKGDFHEGANPEQESTSTENSFAPVNGEPKISKKISAPTPAAKTPASPSTNILRPPSPPPQQQQVMTARGVNTTFLSVDHSSYRDRESISGTGQHSYYGTRSYELSRANRRSPLASLMPIALIAVGVTLGTLAFYPGNPRNLIAEVSKWTGINFLHTEQMASGSDDTQKQAPVPSFDIAISSEPSGATIEVDGHAISDRTPTTVRWPKHSKKRVAVRMQGYLSKEQDVSVDSNMAIEFKLLPERTGRLTVTVIGAGEIYLNGKKVADASPLWNYPVRANEEILVRAIDPVTRLEDERRIRVGENEDVKVTLRPGAFYKVNPVRNK